MKKSLAYLRQAKICVDEVYVYSCRFHSSVVSIELWKEVYCVEDEDDDQHVVMSSSDLSSDDAVTQANTKLAELAPSTDHADKYILAKSLENRDEHIEMD